MKVTSTARLRAARRASPGGIPLPRWGLSLVSTAATGQAGVVSVRTGRVLLTSGGIAEPLHFSRPIGLTWGEILASGQIGELFLDFDDWGQRFDGLRLPSARSDPRHPSGLGRLPRVWGSVILPLRPHDVNVRDGSPIPHPGFSRAGSPCHPIRSPHTPDPLIWLSGVWHDSPWGLPRPMSVPRGRCVRRDDPARVRGGHRGDRMPRRRRTPGRRDDPRRRVRRGSHRARRTTSPCRPSSRRGHDRDRGSLRVEGGHTCRA
jgi:hypothetical protein